MGRLVGYGICTVSRPAANPVGEQVGRIAETLVAIVIDLDGSLAGHVRAGCHLPAPGAEMVQVLTPADTGRWDGEGEQEHAQRQAEGDRASPAQRPRRADRCLGRRPALQHEEGDG